jgi:hypothetical protein
MPHLPIAKHGVLVRAAEACVWVSGVRPTSPAARRRRADTRSATSAYGNRLIVGESALVRATCVLIARGRHVCPLCNAATTQAQLIRNHQFDALIARINEEKERVADKYVTSLIRKGGCWAGNDLGR